MKTTLSYFSLFFALLLGLSLTASAQAPTQVQAKNHLIKTSRFIGFTQMAVKNGQVKSGQLGLSVQYQRYAKALYEKGDYKKAMQFSKRARMFASEACKENKAKPTSDGSFTAEENALTDPMPADNVLDDELKASGTAPVTDEQALQGNLAITIQ
jgi:hypothetical protein